MIEMLPKLFFGYFAVVLVVLSLLIVTRRNPVHSILLMLVMFFHIAGMYLFLNAEFLAAVQVILYAGAVLVMFLFVIMMLNLKKEFTAKRFIREWPIAMALVSSILMLMVFSITNFIKGPSGHYTIELVKNETHTKLLGKVLYTEYLLPFELASLILLIAIVGAIVLTKKRKV